MKLIIVIVLICTIYTLEINCRAHHKVHNLALYPERHSWCTPTPIKQEISIINNSECESTTIDNIVCLGACFSYTVPRSDDDSEVIEPYCDACRPIQSRWTVITLNCTKMTTGERYYQSKSIEIISTCSCVDCHSGLNKMSIAGGSGSGDNDDDTDLDEVTGTEEEEEEEEEIEENNNDPKQNILSKELFNGISSTEEEEEEDEDETINNLKKIPTIKNIKSTSNERNREQLELVDELMLKDNKISRRRSVDGDGNHHNNGRHH